MFEELRCAARCYFLVREDLAHGQYTQLPVGRAHNPAITTPQPRSQGSPGNEVDNPPPPPGEVLLFDKPCRFLPPYRVGFLRHFGMESGTVFEGTTGLHECICRFNSKWVRKKENCANSKWILTACVASVSVWFRSKERPRSGIFDFGHERNEISAKKWKRGEGKGKEGNFAIFPTPSPRFYLRHFSSVPRSSFFAPKPRGNACYAG